MSRAKETWIGFAWGLACACLTLSNAMIVRHLDFMTTSDLWRGLCVFALANTFAILALLRLARNLPDSRAEAGRFRIESVGQIVWLLTGAYHLISFFAYTPFGPGLVGRIAMCAFWTALVLFLFVRRKPSPTPPDDGATMSAALLVAAVHPIVPFLLHVWVYDPDSLDRLPVLAPIVGTGLALAVAALALRKHPLATMGILAAMAAALVITPITQSLGRRFEFSQWNLESAGGPPEKIILISVDTLRADALFPADARPPAAPRMREFAKSNICFRNAMSVAPWTLPSFTSLFTGIDPSVHGVGRSNMKVPMSMRTLAEQIEEYNYLTSAILFNFMLEPTMRTNQGFREYDFMNTHAVEDRIEDWLEELGLECDFRIGGRETDAITERTMRWLDDNSERRSFLWIHYLDPHMPYEPPEEYRTPETGDEFGTRFEASGDFSLEPGKFPEEKRTWTRELYRGEVAYVDDCVGRILDRLRETGNYDDALIILTSDHGEEFWEHGEFEHGHAVYQELLRVPLAIKLPGAERALRIDQTVLTPQLFPTILELLEIPYDPESLDYPSLRPFFDDPATTPALKQLHIGGVLYGDEREVLVEGGLKIIRNFDSGRVELYDLAADPGEHADLAATRPEDVRRLTGALDELRNRALTERDRRGITYDPYDNRVSDELIKGLQKLGYMR